MNLRRLVIQIAIVGFSLLVSGLGVSWFVAGRLVAPAPHDVGDPPSDLNVVSTHLASDSGSQIAAWHSRPDLAEEQIKGVVVLLHGIRSSRASMLSRSRMLHAAGFATVMIDFQAHGESTGETITVGHLEKHDAAAAIEFARSQHPGKPIGVVGVSMGGASALLASPLDVDALVIESVFPNIEAAVANRVENQLGPLAGLPTWLLLTQMKLRLGIKSDDLRPVDFLGRTECPILVASGSKDEHTTAAETRAMFAAAKAPKRLWIADGAGHVDLQPFDPEEYRRHVLPFLIESMIGRQAD